MVIGAGANVGALLVDGLGDGLLLEAPDKDFDFIRNTSFNLLQGCRMRNTKTVGVLSECNKIGHIMKKMMVLNNCCQCLNLISGVCLMPLMWKNFV